MELDMYPITILTDRYGGTYSGGGWLAFNLPPEEIPFEVDDIPLWLTYQGKTLKFMGELTTYRYKIPITSEVTLFLDENHYWGKVDYEMEIEFQEDSFVEAWKTAVLMTTVLGRCFDPNQCFKTSISKYKRFFKRLPKNTEET